MGKLSRTKGHAEWRVVNGWPWYQVSDDGRVRRVQAGRRANFVGRELRPGICRRTGYFSVVLSSPEGKRQSETVHSLVARAFLPPPPGPIGNRRGCFMVNHIDGDKTNNDATNLEWVTPQGNAKHAWGTGLIRPRPLRLTEADVADIRSRYAAGGISQVALAAEYGIHQVTVSEIVLRKIWRHVA